MNKAFNLRARIKSFGYAFEGLATLVKTQPNARIHLLATVLVLGLALYLEVGRNNLCFLLLAISGVWVAEALNTAVEFLADALLPEVHPLVKKAKDVAAAAVLIATLGAVAIGLMIFVPYF